MFHRHLLLLWYTVIPKQHQLTCDKYSIHLGPFTDDVFEACHKHHLHDEVTILGRLEIGCENFLRNEFSAHS